MVHSFIQKIETLQNFQRIRYSLSIIGLPLLMIGMMFPYKIPIFFPYALLLFIVSIPGISTIRINKNVYLYFLVVLSFVLAYLSSKSNNPLALIDFRNVMSTGLFLITINILCKTTAQLLTWMKDSRKTIIYTSLLICVISILKWLLQNQGICFDYFLYNGKQPWGTALLGEFNFFSLGAILGTITSLYELNSIHKKNKYYYVVWGVLIFSSITCFFSGSRRGFLVLLMVLFIYAIIKVYGWVRTKKYGNIRILSIGLLVIFFSFLTILFVRKSINIPDTAKTDITIISYRYYSLMTKELPSVVEFHASVWGGEAKFDHSKIYKSLNQKGVRSRLVLWEFSKKIYSKYSIKEKLVGKGFDYNWEFKRDFYGNTIFGYPHSPFISALLYSGIIGLLILVAYYIQILFYFYSFRKIDTYMFSLFIAISAFTLISGNSFFTIKIYPIISYLSILYKTRVVE